MLKKLASYLLINRPGMTGYTMEEAESLHSRPEDPWFNDSFYFTGHNEKGEWFVTRLGFRHDKPSEVWLDLNIPGEGRLSLNKPCQGGEGIRCGPLSYRCIEPGNRWKILYKGPMECKGKEKKVDLQLEFSGTMPVFDFKKHADVWIMAEALARETWSREWFAKLKDLSQIHYEQGGTLTGQVTVEGKPYHLRLRAMRDHSYGTRKWGAMQQHLWLTALMEDGSFLNVALVRYDFLRHLISGFQAREKRFNPVRGASSLDEVPSGDPIPSKLEVYVKLRDGMEGPLSVRVNDHVHYPMGAYDIYEGIASFTFNGINGAGISEFGYINS